MRVVSLTSFILLPQGKPVETPLALDNIPLPAGLKPPAGALSTLYGFRDALDELSYWRRQAIARRQDFYEVRMTIKRGKMVLSTVGLKDLPGMRFLEMDRVSVELKDALLPNWERLAHGKRPKVDNPFVRGGFLCSRPDLMTRLHDETELRNLDVIVYRIPDARVAGGTRRIAALFSAENVLEVTCVGPNGEVPCELPAFLMKSGRRRA